MIDVTYEKVVKKLYEAVADRGESYVYRPQDGETGACLNWHTDTDSPGCIVGYVFHAFGITGEVLSQDPNATSGNLMYHLVDKELVKLPDSDAERTRIERLLVKVQGYQDTGTPWGPAVARAREEAESFCVGS